MKVYIYDLMLFAAKAFLFQIPFSLIIGLFISLIALSNKTNNSAKPFGLLQKPINLVSCLIFVLVGMYFAELYDFYRERIDVWPLVLVIILGGAFFFKRAFDAEAKNQLNTLEQLRNNAEVKSINMAGVPNQAESALAHIIVFQWRNIALLSTIFFICFKSLIPSFISNFLSPLIGLGH